MKKIAAYLGLGILLVPVSIVSHELGHYLGYLAFGAAHVRLHAFSVSADKDALAAGQLAFVAIVGPLITYATLALAAWATRKNYNPAWTILALAAPVGRIVNAVYVYFRLQGFNPQPNFDEFNFSRNLGIDALPLAIVTTVAAVFAFWFFGRKAWRRGGWRETTLVAAVVIGGLAVWNFTGGLLLP